MSDLITLARPYAKAAFEYAKAHALMDSWSRELTIAGALSTQDEVKSLFTQPSVDEAALVKLFAGEEADEGFIRFIQILSENDRLSLLPEIAELYTHYQEQDSQALTVEVTSAVELDASQQQALIDSLAQRIGKKITLDLQVDNALIGGARIQYGDIVIDGTLKSKIAQLKTDLLH